MSALIFSVVLFLILGLLNPVNYNSLDIGVGFFVFGFSSYSVLKFAKRIGITVSLAIIAWLIYAAVLEFSFLIVYWSLFGILVAFLLEKLKVLKAVAIWILIVFFLLSAWMTSGELRKFLVADLALDTYNNDPGVFLKTYFLVHQGVFYYDAFRTAQLGRFAQKIFPGDIWGWRMPTIFEIWKLLPGSSGLSIYFLFLGIASSLLLVAFKVGQMFLGDSLGFLSAYLLFPYLHFAARDQMFLETEWWAVALFIFSMYFLIIKKYFGATVFLSLTLMIREVYVLPVVLMLIYFFFKKRRLVPIFFIPLASFGALFFLHMRWLRLYIDVWGTLFSPRVVSDGLFFVQQTLAFGSWEYLLFPFRPLAIFTTAATLGCLYLLRTSRREEGVIWLLAFLPFPLVFLRFGTLPYNDYWGIIYAPLAIILAPLLLKWQMTR